MHVALRFAYDGGRFPRGYARQPGGDAAVDTVEDALLAALAGEGLVEGSWRGASRTDAGVSALENVAACDLDRPHLRGLLPALQSRLPEGLWVTGAALTAPDFRPRRAARRSYVYFAPAAGEDRRVLRRACAAFEGRHDMSAFARVEAGRDPLRVVERFWVRRRDDVWLLRCQGHAFLWNQVRRMVDAALRVARGEATVADIKESLRTGVPHPSFRVAPAQGLLLESVAYEPPLAWDPSAGRVVPRAAADRSAQGLVQAVVARHVLDLDP